MPTLSRGIQWSAYLSGLRYVISVLQLLPLAIWRASSWSLFCACPLYLGASSGVPICLASIVRLPSCHFILGIFLGYHWIDLPFIRAPACWSFLFGCILLSLAT